MIFKLGMQHWVLSTTKILQMITLGLPLTCFSERSNLLPDAFITHLPITQMRNRDQYEKSIRGVSGLALEESKMHTFSRIFFSEKYLCKI